MSLIEKLGADLDEMTPSPPQIPAHPFSRESRLRHYTVTHLGLPDLAPSIEATSRASWRAACPAALHAIFIVVADVSSRAALHAF